METSDEQRAAAAAAAEAPEQHVRQWLLDHHVATLGTTLAMRKLQGHPYSSVVPFALDASGRPVILIADMATHTANLQADPRGSLFVREPGLEGDPQKGWRITLIGSWTPVATGSPEEADLHARYVERVPWASGYRQTHDFRYWRMTELRAVRYIGGFGKITWLDGDRCLREPLGAGLAAAAPGAIDHMNADHGHNLLEMVQGRYGVQAERATMTTLDRAGFTVETEGPVGRYRFSFPTEIEASGLRRAVIGVLQQARTASR